MKRLFTALAAVCLCIATGLYDAQAQTPVKTLRWVAHADVKILDPTFTTAYITRNFAYMVYDMLFGVDENGVPKPQMVEKYTTSKDGKLWTFTLRPGLKFSDGNPVTAADAVASMQRWTARDSIGHALSAQAGGEWKTVDARTFTLTLKEPFGLVLEGMSKPSSFPPVIMPERLAKMPTNAPIAEVLGSGPFIFKRDEWVPGNKVVFVRNPNYVARSEAPNALSGSKKPHFDRVEWLYLPDANSAIASLQNGEVDLVELVPPDYITPLRSDPHIALYEAGAWQGWMIMNQLNPPFNNPKVRQALLKAVDQDRFMTAMGFPLNMRMKHCDSFFICGSPNATSAGSEPYRTADVTKARQMLAESGYKGEKVVLLVPSDITYLNAEALMAAQTMRSIGLNVDMQTMDWASVGARRAKRDPVDAGGWSMYVTVAGGFDSDSPITNAYLSAACGNGLPGWPCDEKLDELRTAWLKETVPAKRKQVLDAFQTRAFESVPYIVTGQYSPAFAARKELKNADKMWGGLPLIWLLDK